MKLFAKYSRINLVSTVIIFLTACTAFYFTLNYVFIHQIDEDLKIEQGEIEAFVNEHNALPENISVKDQVIQYQPISGNKGKYFSTSLMTQRGEYEKKKFRHLVFTINAGQQWYQATVSKSLEETENLTRSILIIAFLTILAILFASFIINRVVLKKIWRPFYKSLNLVKEFKVGSDQRLLFPGSGIDEFQLMDATLQKITSQARKDYVSLKTFSENASHEIQTPLAVIRSKLDLMIQDENLTEKQSHLLQAAYNSVQKLTKLNQSLLLLAKIDNKQFEEIKSINLKKKIEEKIADFHELWMAKQLSVEQQLADAMIFINEQLLEVLLNNLISNATKHNINDGKIKITLSEKLLAITNTSHTAALNQQTLFQRFAKESNGNENNGLGLSIIKQICDTSGFVVQYEFTNEMHVFMIRWK
jgi:signal transduction histidine kinase